MIVSGSRGILFNPEMISSEETSDGKYDVFAENKDYTVILYKNVSKANIENIMKRITFQIECQVFKDEDWSHSQW